MRELRAPTVVSADSEGSGPAVARGPAAVLRGSGPQRATRCDGRRGVRERVTARDEVAVMVTAIEVAPVPVTAGDVATGPVTAGDVGGGEALRCGRAQPGPENPSHHLRRRRRLLNETVGFGHVGTKVFNRSLPSTQ